MRASLPTRRELLARTGAAAAGLALARAAWPEEPSGAKKIRLGVVGGNFGADFYFHEHPDCVVAAVSDLRPERRERLKKVYRCDLAYDSLEELIKDKTLDAVAVFTPPPDHVRHVTSALKAGKNALCAVPAAMSLDECRELVDAVKSTGLTYMMAETSWWHQPAISARKFFQEDKFGRVFSTEAEYHHAGAEALAFENGKRTWRYGFPPMHYPTHCTAFLTGITGERLTEVTCLGMRGDSPMQKDNAYQNPFSNAVAFGKTDKGNPFRMSVFWEGAHRGCERAQWYGTKMSFFFYHPNGAPHCIVRANKATEKDAGGFIRQLPEFEEYHVPNWWETDLLPKPLRHDSGHEGAHTFITHEFIDSLAKRRKPAVDVYTAVACTAPGIVAHQSALKDGEQMKVPAFG